MSDCKLILALDIPTKEEALPPLKQLSGTLEWVKIGLQMFCAYGPEWVREVHDLGFRIFLDLKLHDIPNTVAKSVQSLSQLPIDMLTLHTSGGKEMLEWANKARLEHKPELMLLGVTVLTSMDEQQLNAVGVNRTPAQQVEHLAGTAVEAGIPGLVCSAQELQNLSPKFGDQLNFITPGIRPVGASANEQKRVMTPTDAAKAGANYIVVGRPIYQAADPAQAARDIQQELAQA